VLCCVCLAICHPFLRTLSPCCVYGAGHAMLTSHPTTLSLCCRYGAEALQRYAFASPVAQLKTVSIVSLNPTSYLYLNGKLVF
jgi:hypothetical protein